MSGDLAIARYVCRSVFPAGVGLLGGSDPVEASVVDQWLDLVQTRDLMELAATLNAHLAPRCVVNFFFNIHIIYVHEPLCTCFFIEMVVHGCIIYRHVIFLFAFISFSEDYDDYDDER